MTGPVPQRYVPLAKLTGYLLKADHPAGGSKATFFHAFGFSAETPDILRAALSAHPDSNPVEAIRQGPWGIRYLVRCSLKTPDGRNPCILTIWIVPPDQHIARLVTAYPAGT